MEGNSRHRFLTEFHFQRLSRAMIELACAIDAFLGPANAAWKGRNQ